MSLASTDIVYSDDYAADQKFGQSAKHTNQSGHAAPLPNIRKAAALYRRGAQTIAREASGDGSVKPPETGERLIGVLPPLYPEWLGGSGFTDVHRCRFPYIVGEMARGIASADMVIAAARAGLMAFFGSAGLGPTEIDAGLSKIRSALGPDCKHWGANLIHSPQDPEAEFKFTDLALAHGLSYVSASAFLRLSPAIVLLAAKGLRRTQTGQIERTIRIFAKVSRAEVARQFLSPPPPNLLKALVDDGRLTPHEAELAATVPIATDITAEADSGGHTDNRPLTVLLPQLIDLANNHSKQNGFSEPARVGVAGGLGTPSSIAAAFASGAAYVVTGSINQCTIESALSEPAKALLARAEMTDVAMAPAADMFEMGVKVQVLKRGTLFAQRGNRLFETYRRYRSIEDIPSAERKDIETNILGRTIAQIWADTEAYFLNRDSSEVARAASDPHHKMALVFRWYLFMGAEWARSGDTQRQADYQIWCGPAMGGFNDWVRGSFLATPENRRVDQIALNLLEGAAHITRASQLRAAGVPVPPNSFEFRPRRFC